MLNQIRQSIPRNIFHNKNKDTPYIFKKSIDANYTITEDLPKKSTKDNNQNVRKYTKGRFLGKGGFAKCYELICQDNNKTFAAKMLPLSDIKTERQRQKLLTEIKIHKSLHHQQIVAFEHYFKDKTNVYILLELCQNQTLNELFERRKKLSEIEVQCYMIQLIKALQYLHSHRVIHRDLKLGNLFLNDKMELKVGDFGLATKLDFEGERKKTVCGTPNYIAPEVLYGTGHSYEVDIWALGVIIYTLLIGKPPFETREVKTTYNKIKKAEFSFPITCKISSAARNIIKKILILDPKKRPTLNDILSDEFFNQGIAIPKLLPLSTLALPLTIEYIKKFIPQIENIETSSKEKSVVENKSIKKSNSGKNIIGKELTKDTENICDEAHLISTKNIVPELLKNIILKKEIWVTKWVDYSNKFGLGYVLNNGYIGVYFNDTTKIILNPQIKKFTYIDKKMAENQELLYTFLMKEYPDEIKKKVDLFNLFKNYLDEENNKNKANEETNSKEKSREKSKEKLRERSKEKIREKSREKIKEKSKDKIKEKSRDKYDEKNEEKKSPNKHKNKQNKKKGKDHKKLDQGEPTVNAFMQNSDEIDFIYVKKWVKTKHAIIFRFSNKAIQVCFKDRTEIYLHTINENITYTNKNGVKITYPLSNALNSSNFEMNKRVKYTKQVLTYMINANKNKKIESETKTNIGNENKNENENENNNESKNEINNENQNESQNENNKENKNENNNENNNENKDENNNEKNQILDKNDII